jgi:multidrug efflux pump subunit AcrA (membrane-fusion protein)
VMDSDKTLRYKPVNIIRQEGANVVISEGLESGMQVITSALDYPLEGMQLALPEDKILQDESVETEQTELAMEGK